MRKFWTLLAREVRSYFYSPIAYIVMIFFLIISGIDFYFQVSFMNQRQVQYTIQEAFFNSVFFWFAFVLIFPLITMRLFAEEFKDRKSTRLNSSHRCISYAVFCLKK